MRSPISYKQIFHATSNGIVVTDATGTIIYFNKQAERILDLQAAKHIGLYICDVLPLTGQQVIECLQTGKPKLGHHIIGKKVNLVLNITLIEQRKVILGTVCSFQEMQEFENAARKLESYKQLNRQLETIFKTSFDGIWVCNGEGKVININEASERLNGIRAEEVVGKNIADLVAEDLFDRSVTLEVLDTKRQVSLMQYVPRTGRYLLATGTPAFDEKGNIYLVVVNERDMTDLNAIREELEESYMVNQKIKAELAELSILELRGQEIIAESKQMRQVLRVALKLAQIRASNILLLGESGTGKGLLAKFIHQHSERKSSPFIQINCAALPETLLEAELFGYEYGAFTGARKQGKAGLFELAHKGTLFLDEIGDLPLPLQAKLLKCLDDHEIMRLGGLKALEIDCLVIAATNQDLEQQVKRKRFRQDLYYRLNTFSIKIPPLRERPDDVFGLAHHFLAKYNKLYGMRKRFRAKAMEMFQQYPFPGNVRELKNLIKRAVVMSESAVLDDFLVASMKPLHPADKPGGLQPQPSRPLVEELSRLEREILRNTMSHCKTTRELAAHLGISQPTIVRKMKKHGLAFS
ncbi:MAG: sigma 54-interacting transcriptional regulator [Deltaproteobacteria bacterium]|nr:sigma 54-interacting transcriptional regulator [Deltaproteobacteria bacterium]MBW2072367.1 sigma 54-interacting transcriptional regulator [Deltaproteobacteria bacterium]